MSDRCTLKRQVSKKLKHVEKLKLVKLFISSPNSFIYHFCMITSKRLKYYKVKMLCIECQMKNESKQGDHISIFHFMKKKNHIWFIAIDDYKQSFPSSFMFYMTDKMLKIF